MIHKFLACILTLTFVMSDVRAYAQGVIQLPAPGTRLALSPTFTPPLLKGIKVYRNDPFRFDFILDKGDDKATDDQVKIDSTRLIKYFLASLTVPEKDLWVNLSPYEKDRIVPEAFGQTEMGRDLLAQDYILKQITASVIYPDEKVGKEFWAKVYAEALKRYGTTDIPVDTFNKVWIVPQKATVYEHQDAAYVVESRLKVMLESDYKATEENEEFARRGGSMTRPLILDTPTSQGADRVSSDIAKQVLRDIIIPILDKEVNQGQNFATLRQVYNSLILATWYKRTVKASIMGQAYVDQKKTGGIDIADKNEKEKIWAQYVEAFKKGAYNLIKEEVDPATREVIPRKYFSGGMLFDPAQAFKVTANAAMLLQGVPDNAMLIVRFDFKTAKAIDRSMGVFKERLRMAWIKLLNKIRRQGVKSRIIEQENIGTDNVDEIGGGGGRFTGESQFQGDGLKVVSYQETDPNILYTLTQMGTRIRALGTVHGNPLALIVTNNVLQEISSTTKDSWLFLVEGVPSDEEWTSTPEIDKVYEVALKNSIALEQAIVSSVAEEVTRELLHRSLATEEEVFVEGIVSDLPRSPSLVETIQFILYCANKITVPEVMHEKVERILRYMVSAINNGDWEKESRRLAQVHTQARIISNQLTTKKIKEALMKYPEKKEVFVQMGRSHLPSIVKDYVLPDSTVHKPKELEATYRTVVKGLFRLLSVVRPGLMQELDVKDSKNGRKPETFFGSLSGAVDFIQQQPLLKSVFGGLSNKYRKGIFISEIIPCLLAAIGKDAKLWNIIYKIKERQDNPAYNYFDLLSSVVGEIQGTYGKDVAVMKRFLDMLDEYSKANTKVAVFLEDIVSPIVGMAKDADAFFYGLNKAVVEVKSKGIDKVNKEYRSRFYAGDSIKVPSDSSSYQEGGSTQSVMGTRNKGGIDVNLNNIDFKSQGNGEEIKFDINPVLLARLQNASGVTPVVVGIQPLDSLQQFMGVSK